MAPRPTLPDLGRLFVNIQRRRGKGIGQVRLRETVAENTALASEPTNALIVPDTMWGYQTRVHNRAGHANHDGNSPHRIESELATLIGEHEQ